MSHYEDIPERKNPRVFKHVHDGPEVARGGRRWPKSKCKRNKGAPHDYRLDEERNPKYGPREWVDRWAYRRRPEGMQRALYRQERVVYYTCAHCGRERNDWERRNETEWSELAWADRW